MNTVFVCPKCSSSLVEFSSLHGGAATCKACSWAGTREKLLDVGYTDLMPEQTIQLFFAAVHRELLPILGTPLVKLLLRWGLMEKLDEKSLQPFLKDLLVAIPQCLIATRVRLEKERAAHG